MKPQLSVKRSGGLAPPVFEAKLELIMVRESYSLRGAPCE
jgi:hypothetical protein